MCVLVCVCWCVCVCVCVSRYDETLAMHVHVYMHAHANTPTQMYMYVHAQTRRHKHAHTHTRTHTHCKHRADTLKFMRFAKLTRMCSLDRMRSLGLLECVLWIYTVDTQVRALRQTGQKRRTNQQVYMLCACVVNVHTHA